MKDLFNLLQKDILSENFTRRELVIYGFFAPMALIAVCIMAEVINAI